MRWLRKPWTTEEPAPESSSRGRTVEALRRLEVVTDRLEVVSTRFESQFNSELPPADNPELPAPDNGDADDSHPD